MTSEDLPLLASVKTVLGSQMPSSVSGVNSDLAARKLLQSEASLRCLRYREVDACQVGGWCSWTKMDSEFLDAAAFPHGCREVAFFLVRMSQARLELEENLDQLIPEVFHPAGLGAYCPRYPSIGSRHGWPQTFIEDPKR